MANIVKKGLTYSDVLLVPKRSKLHSRSEADTKTKVTKNVFLSNPIISSNMASVTEHKLAIALAQYGGMGVIHQFMSIEEQAKEVRRVKRSTGYVVEEPITARKDISLKEAKEFMHEKNVTCLILIDDTYRVEGILSHRDYEFKDDDEIKISELMTPKEKLITANPDIDFSEAKKILFEKRIEKLILVDNGFKLKGLITTKDMRKIEDLKYAARDKKGRLIVGAAIGVKDSLERAKALVNAGVDVLVLDIAHAHSDLCIEQLKKLKQHFTVDILAGNVATKEAAIDLIQAGADGLKVGIGPSPVCSTRTTAGAGIPQLTAIMDVYEIAKAHDVPICADGGITYPGDVTKAIAAGADTIMTGSHFAGCDESPTPVFLHDGKKVKQYFGSASFESSINRKEMQDKKRVKQNFETYVEGVLKYVDYKGSAVDALKFLVRGLQSGISYAGARNIKELKQNAEFIEITSSGWMESMTRK